MADFVDDKDDVLLAALFADDVDHLLDTLVLELEEALGAGRKGFGFREERRVHRVGDFWNQSVNGQGVVLHPRPGGARQGLGDALLEFWPTAILFDHALVSGHLEVARIAGPLEHLEVEDGGDVLHGGAGEHFAGQVQHDHRGRVTLGDRA